MSDNHKKDQTTPSSSSGSSNNEKNVLQNVSDYYNQALFWYRNIDVKGTVGKYRENINQVVFDNPILKQIEHWPHKPKEVAAEIDRDLRAVSVKFNDSFPYAASMCRSHSTFVLGSFLAITILPLWGRAAKFKTVAKAVVGLGLLGQGSLEVINYQWRNDPNKPEDPVSSPTHK